MIRDSKKNLKNWISNAVSNELQLFEKLRTFKKLGQKHDLRFDIRKFRTFNNGKQMTAYAKQYLQRLGAGIGRETFLLSSGKVLKIAYRNDVRQNEFEIAAFEKFGPDYMPVIYETHPDGFWIISELVKTFQTEEQFVKETGLSSPFLRMWARFKYYDKKDAINMDDFSSWFTDNFPELANATNITTAQQTITPRGKEFLTKFTHLLAAGVDDIQKWDHWGVGTDQRFVCVDVGYEDK